MSAELVIPLSVLREQGLDILMQELQTMWSDYEWQATLGNDDDNDKPTKPPSVCMGCWQLWEPDLYCNCNQPQYWPLNHAIAKLRHVLGREKYEV